jgi:hypothetical protein
VIGFAFKKRPCCQVVESDVEIWQPALDGSSQKAVAVLT